MVGFRTEQEKFWHGSFGDDYIRRNQDKAIVAANISLFARILASTKKISSVIEFGANIGLNLMALHQLLPDANLAGIEINEKASKKLGELGYVEVYEQSILDFVAPEKFDMTLIKGVLIHIAPEELQNVYEKLYEASNRYICLVEYYNPKPVEIDYRGHSGKMFKRDFAGELLEKYSSLKLVDYGFVYHGDNNFPQDDLTWFLLRKSEEK